MKLKSSAFNSVVVERKTMTPEHSNPYAPPETKAEQEPQFRFRMVYRIAGRPAYSGKLSIWPQRIEIWNAIGGQISAIPMERVARARTVFYRCHWTIEIAYSPEKAGAKDECSLIRWADFSRFLSPYQRAPLETVCSYLNDHAGLQSDRIPEWPRWHWF